MTTAELSFSDFTRIEVEHAIQVEVEQSGTYGVSLNLQNFQIKDVRVSKEGDKLKIGRRMTPRAIIAAPVAKIGVRITMPDLFEITLSGASHGMVQGFSSGQDFALNLSGASSLDMANMSAGAIKVHLSGASHITGKIAAGGDADLHLSEASKLKLDGSAKDVVIDASGASHADLDNFRVHNANVKLSGASQGNVNLDGKLDVKLAGASKLSYLGNPTMGSMDIAGVSTLSRA